MSRCFRPIDAAQTVLAALLVLPLFPPIQGTAQATAQSLTQPNEMRFGFMRQITFQGENAEAYWAPDGETLVFQSTPTPGEGCDQIFTFDLKTGARKRVSTGAGRTTCSYFFPDGETILYSSTHHYDEACPVRPDYSRGYVWPVYSSFDIFVTNADGTGLRQLTDTHGYDAEATFSPTGHRIIFTSTRDGDLDLYSMLPDGSDLRRVTDRIGYDGGAFYSPDGSKIVWRAHYPETDQERDEYLALLADDLIRPSALEIYVADADGTNPRQITDNGAANFAPFWHPSGDKVIFSSNLHDPGGRDFELYLINVDGSGLERVTWSEGFDGFPVFSPDGTKLAFGSNRNMAHEGNTNIFLVDWLEGS